MTSKSSTGSRPVARRHVDHVHQHLRPFEVREELRAEAVAVMRAFDQARARRRRRNDAVAAQLDDAEIRRERRERVVGDLRPRLGDARDQRALAGVRETRPGRRRPAASAAGAACAARRASPARCAAARDWSTSRTPRCRGRRVRRARRARARRRVVRSASGISSSPCFSYTTVPGGTSSTRSSPSRPVQFGAQAVLAALGLELRMEAVGDERVVVRAGDEVDRAARAAVAAVRAAARHELLAAEGSCSRCRRRRPGRGCRLRRRT